MFDSDKKKMSGNLWRTMKSDVLKILKNKKTNRKRNYLVSLSSSPTSKNVYIIILKSKLAEIVCKYYILINFGLVLCNKTPQLDPLLMYF